MNENEIWLEETSLKDEKLKYLIDKNGWVWDENGKFTKVENKDLIDYFKS